MAAQFVCVTNLWVHQRMYLLVAWELHYYSMAKNVLNYSQTQLENTQLLWIKFGLLGIVT